MLRIAPDSIPTAIVRGVMNGNDNNEDQQLLQDASTLLMFANVAAKQQQQEQHHHQQQHNQLQQQQQNQSPAAIQRLPQLHTNQTQIQTQPQSLALTLTQSPTTNTGQIQFQNSSQIQGGGMILQRNAPLMQQPQQQQQPQPQQPPMVSPQFYKPVDLLQLQPYSDHVNNEYQRKQYEAHPELQKDRKTSQDSDHDLPKPSTFKHHHLPSTEPSNQTTAQSQSKSPTSSTMSSPPLHLPVQGSFVTPRGAPLLMDHVPQVAHKRTKSESDRVSFKHLPGPANVALLEKDKSGSAMIAAAALAAAADMPMPLVKAHNAPTINILTSASSLPKPTALEVKMEPPLEQKNVKDPIPRSHHIMPSIHMLTNPTESNKVLLETREKVLSEMSEGNIGSATESLETSSLQSIEMAQAPSSQASSDHKQQLDRQDSSKLEEKVQSVPQAIEKQLGTEKGEQHPESVSSNTEITESKPESISHEENTTSPTSTNREIKVTLKYEPGLEVRRNTVGIEPKERQVDNNDNNVTTTRKYQPPPLETYKVDPDLGLIGCVCDIDDDDGFTIQCDICFRWQHCLCMGFMTSEEVPEDEYKCYYCDPNKWGKFNAEKCRAETLARITNEKKTMANNVQATSGASTEENTEEKRTDMEDFTKEKRKSHNQDKLEKNEKRRKVEEGGGDNAMEQSVGEKQITPSVPELPNPANQLLDDGISAENYQSVYFKLKSNDYKNNSVKEHLEQVGTYFQSFAASLTKAEQLKLPIEIQSMAGYKQTKFCRIILPNQIRYLQSHREHKVKTSGSRNKYSIQVKSYNENLKQKFNAVSKLGLFLSLNESHGHSNNLGLSLTLSSNNSPSVVPGGTPIIEYLGEINFFSSYTEEKINQYKTLGCTKQYVVKTTLNVQNDMSVDLVLDSRFVGNESRFIRKACPNSTNCKIVPIYIHSKNLFKFIVVTKHDIELTPETPEVELSLDWDWDDSHPIQRFYKDPSIKFEQLNEEDRKKLIIGIDNLLPFVDCGCNNALGTNYQSQCAVFKVKKAITFLLRSQRKASQISNINLSKSKEELLFPHRTKEYHSWTERLGDRDKLIQMKLSVSTSDTLNELQQEQDHEQDPEEQQQELDPEVKQHDDQNPEEKQQYDESNDKDESIKQNMNVKGPAIALGANEQPQIKSSYKALIKQPYKKLLVARTRVKILNVYSTKPSEKVLESTLDVPIPVVPEVQLLIEKQINEELNKNITELKQIISPQVIEAAVEQPAEIVVPKIPPQPTIKKLLFADYKKKMK
ncbi:uncharacterized protein KQ657_003487 [Scheffersomyces spartinae]|uniref:Zinc finger PHD-type domain-containing protein n=1 Tax=Scheffersomyces spartinae TaxID=45513 RepID=A0A9P8AGB4_9ASCO|nr:uncharacterized protein KQ657_003487 [Scheffersomyces spartinae]KAG7191366.1 hypothetical protein KQ657_003487 [Scheffersomyces spartinae]